MTDPRPSASFITFYSFKGGVGRSMALINTAGLLAGRGFRVLVIDMDLEAPGLSFLDPHAPDVPPSDSRQIPYWPGIVDLLCDAKERGKDADLFQLSAEVLVERYAQSYHLPESICKFPDGSLHIMPAGRMDEGYTRRFDLLNLHALYAEGLGEPLIRAFKRKFAEAGLFDYILVDSRTGFSDEAGICTRDLADHLMILTGLNRQNIEGTCKFLRALRSATNGQKQFQIILSPVPNGEDALVDQREQIARAAFQEAWGGEVKLSLQIPYHPQLALTEEPHIFRRSKGYLFQSYRRIEQSMLAALSHDAETFRSQVTASLGDQEYGMALDQARFLSRLNRGTNELQNILFELLTAERPVGSEQRQNVLSDQIVPLEEMLQHEAGRQFLEFLVENATFSSVLISRDILKRLEHASPDLAEKAYQRIIAKSPTNAGLIWAYSQFLLYRRNDPGGADRLFRQAVEVAPDNAAVLAMYALFLANHRGDLNGAEQFYKRALEADPKGTNILGNYALFLAHQRGDLDAAEQSFKRALEADPGNALNLGNYASLLAYHRGDLDAAEQFYKRALEADPRDAAHLGNYANFLANKRGNLDAAEQFYKRALETDPKHANNLGNYGQFLAGNGRLAEARTYLQSGLDTANLSDADLAEVCFSLWLVNRLLGQDASQWESAFKFLIERDFPRHPWTFDRMLAQAAKTLSADEFHYTQALATAFLDNQKVPELQNFERWRNLQSIDPNQILKSDPTPHGL